VLRDGEVRRVLEYSPASCSFVDGVADAEQAYIAGLECWACDLLAVLDAELGPIGLTFGRARVWNALPSRFNFEIFNDLHRFSHPLRRPAEYFKLYERLLAPVRDTPARYFAR
jgi:hypothetical protein